MRVREGCGGKGAAECLCGMQHMSSLASTVCVWGGGGGGDEQSEGEKDQEESHQTI